MNEERIYELKCKVYKSGDISLHFQKSIIYTIYIKAHADKYEYYHAISITSNTTNTPQEYYIKYFLKSRLGEELKDQLDLRRGIGIYKAILIWFGHVLTEQ